MDFFLSVPSEIGRHCVIGVVGQREIARQIDLDAVALADRDRRQNVQEFVENLRGGLSRALRKSLAHEVGAGAVSALPVPASATAPRAPMASETPKMRR